VVETGFRLMWDSCKAPLRNSVPAVRLAADVAAHSTLSAEVEKLLQKRAIEQVPRLDSPGYYGRLFTVPKATGGHRPVLDLSRLNLFLVKQPFRMETAESIRRSLRPGDWATSLDLMDAYFHVSIHPADRKFLRFPWADTAYQFRALPFGLSLAPWIFTRLVRELAAVVRSKGIRFHTYIDDWLIPDLCPRRLARHTTEVQRLAAFLGFTVNLAKSDLVPSQRFTFLGMDIDTAAWLVRPTAERLDRLSSLLSQLLPRSQSPARLLVKLLGLMESLAPLIPMGRVFKRPVQRGLRARWIQTLGSYEDLVVLDQWFREAVSPWLDRSFLLTGVPVAWGEPELFLVTDASEVGWGAHLGVLATSGLWTPEQTRWHSNQRELMAVFLALQYFEQRVSGKVVSLSTDNTSVACYINRQGGVLSPSLSLLAESLLKFCWMSGVTLIARYLPGKLNLVADQLSRPGQILTTEWTLSQRVLARIWSRWEKPVVDLFATQFNFRLPVYVSPVQDGQAWRIDAFSFAWTGLQAYAFPPFALIHQVLLKAAQSNMDLVLVAPKWPARPWFNLLLELAVDSIDLRVELGELRQPVGSRLHLRPDALDLHAWRLSPRH